ncbi:hypothetical protein HBI56_064480 [Parastagonospora nodorum]|uniref:Uncharacterized protein n=1 Tax=Phaeosphaeria nodorum (strain SN15 / ATCC MYA-4574 / FGSC 10173) TaxID=321614 RepID=A0A7U2F304_PHANO|nr:hypothetical protein HBH56_198980 [Parastagonospora nodorum]QRC97733.1 hypothetical protein JI435_410930 [Parastagonospora nodorum SN15]KAH3924634.1 hypothetical protein HBH54_191940 [Parastagonospora nodorum]KAH3942008.1 hypothetical protein HBH53_193400 [Parastagonospora nodorum]KAH3957777.1 hypothetical protein HBH51_219400 [Parastagonospora nodorum]
MPLSKTTPSSDLLSCLRRYTVQVGINFLSTSQQQCYYLMSASTAGYPCVSPMLSSDLLPLSHTFTPLPSTSYTYIYLTYINTHLYSIE